ncbi:replication initiation and membrane attachment family protein [Bacillus sp. CGMCC 1.16607]|uniref:replication initiation and membrane attachment family protein n=1 Tax=Bacillus sp. CGMCC 1.16607 TaxID=3351842 RepID=UPI0036347146
MAQHWQELLPIDRYIVSSDGLLHYYDQKILTFLYQPLIGSTAFSLYMTLWGELEENRLWSEPTTHHSLMNFLDVNLKDIYQSRQKLEGIGLLKTFVKVDADERSFIYELQPPLNPERFFLDGMLNIYLYQKIGKNHYARLKRFFSDQQSPQTDEYKDISKAFHDVYSTASPESLQLYQETPDLKLEVGKTFIGRNESKAIQIHVENFNFDLLIAGLQESLVPRKVFTQRVKEAIANLAFLYNINALQMQKIVLNAVEDDVINIEELRKSARDWFQFQNQDQLPALVDRVQPELLKVQRSEPNSKEEELKHYFETVSPRQFLMDISGGGEPGKSDLQIVEDIMFQQQLSPAVVNVLIHYVLIKTDMKLTKSYVEKIASHWARKGIATVNDAMELAIKENRQYLEWASGKKTKKSNDKKPIRTELIPDWFNEEEKAPLTKKEIKLDSEAKKRALEERLKKYKK